MGGKHDVVKDTLSQLGTIQFRKVAMQPGMPQGFGTIGEDSTPIFTLPGNPVSAYVSPDLRADRIGRPQGRRPAAAVGAGDGDRPAALSARPAVLYARR